MLLTEFNILSTYSYYKSTSPLIFYPGDYGGLSSFYLFMAAFICTYIFFLFNLQ